MINGDVADRGRNATEILLLIFAFMLAAPGQIVMNRGAPRPPRSRRALRPAPALRQR